MPRRRVKRSPKPVHVLPTQAVVTADTSDPSVNTAWLRLVTTAYPPRTHQPMSFEDACIHAATLSAHLIAAAVIPVLPTTREQDTAP